MPTETTPQPPKAPAPHAAPHAVPTAAPQASAAGPGDPVLAAARAAWAGLARGAPGGVPARMDLDPARLLPILGHAALLEQPRPGVVRLRLGGGRLAAWAGMEVRGLPLRALFAVPDRGAVMAAVAAVFARPARLEAALWAPGAAGLVETGLVILPLRDAGGAVSRALLVLGAAAQAAPGPVPARWRVRGLVTRPVAGTAAAPAGMPKGPPVLRVIRGGRA